MFVCGMNGSAGTVAVAVAEAVAEAANNRLRGGAFRADSPDVACPEEADRAVAAVRGADICARRAVAPTPTMKVHDGQVCS